MRDPLLVLADLTRFGRALSGALRRETVADCTRECLETLFAPGAGAVVYVSDEADRYTLAAAYGDPPPDIGDPFFQEVHVSGRLIHHTRPERLGTPIVAAGHTMGILAAWGKDFDQHSEAVIANIASQAAIALQNTRLIELLSGGKQEWEKMVDAIHPAIAIVDGKGAVRRANRAFAVLAGATVTSVSGRPWLNLLPAAWIDAVGKALALPGAEEGEVRIERRVFSVRAHPVEAAAGTSVLVIDDVTETRRLQDQLVQSEKLSAIGQLIAGVAHELNNPLASVLGFADFLSESGQTPEGLLEPVHVIQHEAQRAAGIVKNLLTFARRQEQDRRRVDVVPILERTIQLLNNQFLGLKVEARLVAEPNLPQVEGSPNQLQQVFLNVINNAAQAIAGARKGSLVEVRARRWLDGVAIEVIDDGPGIPAELHQRIFEPFYTTKPEGEGTGLGLSICQGIIKEHGGRIRLQSESGRGATFTIELPGTGAGPQAAAAPAQRASRSASILVVDDEPHILYYMKATLEAWGHTVHTANDGVAGLKLALEGGHDVIITDVRMPRLGGREFYERLAAEAPDAASRVVFATGDTVRDDTMAFIERSGQPFLHKPFKLAELRNTSRQSPW